jgi:hypothetical protein
VKEYSQNSPRLVRDWMTVGVETLMPETLIAKQARLFGELRDLGIHGERRSPQDEFIQRCVNSTGV